MSDLKVQQRQALSRQEAARFIAGLAEGLGDGGTVTLQLGSSTLELSVAGQVDCELEVVVDGDEMELEVELKWSISDGPSLEAAQDQPEADDLEQDESDEEASEAPSEEDEDQEDSSEETGSNAAAEEALQGGSPDEEAAGSSEAESVPPAAPVQSEKPRRRRKAAAVDGMAASNGVDTAAVRAWAAANGLTVSPRGRIKDEVIEAYRAAGN